MVHRKKKTCEDIQQVLFSRLFIIFRCTTVKKKDENSLELKDKFSVESSNIESYEPFSHRKVEHPTTWVSWNYISSRAHFIKLFRSWDTFFHLLKGSLGTGILAMPNAFNNSGYVSICVLFSQTNCTNFPTFQIVGNSKASFTTKP